jgi:2-C-methyl-D-erythritol 4-phosphate cytidylyltransferase
MLSWTLAALLAEPRLQRIMVALAPDDTHWRTIPEMNDPRVRRCDGGDRREHTVARGLDALAGEARETDWALVHDAARPCLRPEDIALLIDTLADDTVGGLLALPLGDTLKRADDSTCSLETVPRDRLWRALTPQMFRVGLLRRALGLCRERDRAVTDEASAVESLGLRPRLLRGHADNIKVTNPEDAALAEAILRREQQ